MSDDLKIRALLWAAGRELNEIRARDGVPRTYDGTKAGVSEEYFSDLVDAIAHALGGDITPWCPREWKDALTSALEATK